MSYKTSFKHDLEIPVKIASGGKEVEAVSVEVFAPTNQVSADVNVLDSEFHKARKNAVKDSSSAIKDLTVEQIETFKKLSDSSKEVKEGDAKPLDIVREMIMYGADMDRCVLALKNILIAGRKEKPMCLVDVEKMTTPIFEELSVIDTKSILGLYILSFLDTSRGM